MRDRVSRFLSELQSGPIIQKVRAFDTIISIIGNAQCLICVVVEAAFEENIDGGRDEICLMKMSISLKVTVFEVN